MNGKLISRIGMLIYAAAIVAPLVWVIISSFKSGFEIFESPWALPAKPQWSNYQEAWREAGIGHNFFNSLVVTSITLAVLIPCGAMAAYVFARYPFRGSRALFTTFLGGMMFPNFLVIVPLFFLLRNLALLDTLTGLIIVYVAYSLSFTIFVLTGFFQILPASLQEAAMVDGCGHSKTFWKVMLPLARPGLLVVAIFNAIGLWNEYNLALVLLPSDKNRTLPLGIADLVMTQHYQSNWGALFAGLVIVMLPMMVVYWAFRDRIYQTMLAGALKG
jgi:N-acetylglucosamine transport system permease protein